MAGQATVKKPRLRNLDDVFLISEVDEQSGEAGVALLNINTLVPFEKHPFCIYTGERLDDMVDSIIKNGVLVPLIVRPKGDRYEILSGHNRANAAVLAGLVYVPAIIKKDLSDDEAWMYVIETNLMQRSFSELSHSEKAAVIATRHSKLFSQGKRNDILIELQKLENPDYSNVIDTCAQVAHKMKSRDIVAKEYSLSKDTVARYIRIHKLIDALKTRLDNGGIAFLAAWSLSFLSVNEQELLEKCLTLNSYSVDMKKADMLRQYSKSGKLDEESIYLILSGEVKLKAPLNRTPTVKIRKSLYSRYFKPEQSAKEVQDIVEQALELYFRELA